MSEKLIVILGGGESGVGTALLALKNGFKVFLSDNGILKDEHRETLKNYDIDFEEGGHTADKILQADEVVKSPGIPDSSPIIMKLKEKGVVVISEIEFAAR